MRSSGASKPAFKARPLIILLSFFMTAVMAGGCASNMTGYYADLRTQLDNEDYDAAAHFVDKSKGKYKKKNVLLYYLDAGMVNHFAKKYDKSINYFEQAKEQFDFYYQKSITAGASTFVFNDTSAPYYGEDFERMHVTVFEALNYILKGDDNEAVVEARQADTLFKTFAVEANNKNFYKDDGFIRYFMGLVYENGGYLNDANLSYFLAIKAYRDGLAGLAPPVDLINDAYGTSVALGMTERAAEIKAMYPNAKRKIIPKGYGECIIIDYNGLMPKKIDNVLEFALFDIWPYINQVEVDGKEQKDFEQARSMTVAAFSNDYVKVSFPKYKSIPNRVKNFEVLTDEGRHASYTAQNLGTVAQKTLDAEITKIYIKTLARAAVKYAVGKSVSKAVEDNSNESWGILTQIAFNVVNSATETADKRAWYTLPDNILMSRIYLPAGENEITVNFLGSNKEIVKQEDITVNVREGRKTFVVLRSAYD